jgi:hypothetical protein
MSHAEAFISLGFSGVVVISEDSREERSGNEDERTRQAVACRDEAGQTWRLTITWEIRWRRSMRHTIVEKLSISLAEYRRLAKAHGPRLDPSGLSKRLAARAAARETAREKLSKLAPECPACRRPMVARSGEHGRFWGCTMYPKCKETQKMSVEAKRWRKRF